jgi:hemoglobin
MEENTQSVYEQLGDDGFRRLAAAFYRRIAEDVVLNAVYPKQDRAGAERRLGMFLVQYFGGPTSYSNERGHPRLRMRHQPFQIGEVERDSWLAAMLAAMEEIGIPEPAYTAMRDYFENAATFLMNVSSFRNTGQ